MAWNSQIKSHERGRAREDFWEKKRVDSEKKREERN